MTFAVASLAWLGGFGIGFAVRGWFARRWPDYDAALSDAQRLASFNDRLGRSASTQIIGAPR